MAAYTPKIFALFALLALFASSAMATTNLQYFPPMMAMGTTDPCSQYMMQAFGVGGSAAMMMWQSLAFLRQQCCMQLQGMMPQCHCGASSQMLQNTQQVLGAYYGGLEQQQMMMKMTEMAMRMPYMCSMPPAYF